MASTLRRSGRISWDDLRLERHYDRYAYAKSKLALMMNHYLRYGRRRSHRSLLALDQPIWAVPTAMLALLLEP